MPACERDPLARLPRRYRRRRQGRGTGALGGTATNSPATTAAVGMATPNAGVAMVALSLDTVASVGMATPGPGCRHHHRGGHGNNVDVASGVSEATLPWQWHRHKAPCHHSPVVTYLRGERDTQQEARNGHPQRHEGLPADDPLVGHFVHDGRDQRLQQAELRVEQSGQHVTTLAPPWHPTPTRRPHRTAPP